MTAQNADGPMLIASQVCKSYGTVQVLNRVSLTIPRGSVTCILGPSGSGKSTLLRCVNHLEPMDSGRIWLDGELIGYRYRRGRLHEMPDHLVVRQRAKMGMVFQQFNLFPHMSVMDNMILAPMSVQRRNKAEATAASLKLLESVGLGHRATAYPSALSGGQQQRVAIARALAMRPKLMLFDEPTSALDPELVGDVLLAIKELAFQGITMVVVTHEIGFAREVADHVVFMDEGIIVEEGPARQVLEAPTKERTKTFLSAVR